MIPILCLQLFLFADDWRDPFEVFAEIESLLDVGDIPENLEYKKGLLSKNLIVDMNLRNLANGDFVEGEGIKLLTSDGDNLTRTIVFEGRKYIFTKDKFEDFTDESGCGIVSKFLKSDDGKLNIVYTESYVNFKDIESFKKYFSFKIHSIFEYCSKTGISFNSFLTEGEDAGSRSLFIAVVQYTIGWKVPQILPDPQNEVTFKISNDKISISPEEEMENWIESIVLSEKKTDTLEDLIYEKEKSFSATKGLPNEYINNLESRRGIFNEGDEIIIKTDDEKTIKIFVVKESKTIRKLIYDNVEINFNRNKFMTRAYNSGYSMYVPDYNSLGIFKKSIHGMYSEGYRNYKSLDDFRKVKILASYRKNGYRYDSYSETGVYVTVNIVDAKNCLHVSVNFTQILIDWKIPNNLPPSEKDPKFEIKRR